MYYNHTFGRSEVKKYLYTDKTVVINNQNFRIILKMHYYDNK